MEFCLSRWNINSETAMTKRSWRKTYVVKTPSLNCPLIYVFVIIPDSWDHEQTDMNTHERVPAPHTPQIDTHAHTTHTHTETHTHTQGSFLLERGFLLLTVPSNKLRNAFTPNLLDKLMQLISLKPHIDDLD